VSASQYVVGVVVLVSIAASLVVGAVSLRRLFLPAWDGALARLAELVVGAALLVVVVELLGSVGALQRWTLVAAMVLAAVAAWAFMRRRGVVVTRRARGSPPRPDRASVVVLAAIAPFLFAPWLRQTADAVRLGMLEYDTLWYHLPFAARFAQDGWIVQPHHVGNPPDAFLPATSELFHAVGMLAFATDVVSPFLNLAWAGVFVLAAWCVGRPLGAQVATTAAAGVVLALPVMVASQAGSAQSDMAGLALLTAAVAFVVADQNSAGAAGLAGLAAGLSIGAKLTLVAPALLLAVGAVVVARPGRRKRVAVAWAVGLAATGAYWYVRNIVYTGTPLPWFGFRVAGLHVASTGPTIDCGTTSLADLLTEPAELRAHVYPFMSRSLGPVWLLVLAAGGAGIVAAVAARRRMHVLLGVVALLAVAAYVVTPATAGGAAARCFSYNTRFAAPALMLALLGLALALAGRGRWHVLGCAVILGSIAVVTSKPTPNTSFLTALVVVALLVLAVLAASRLAGRRGLVWGAAALLLVAVLVAGWPLQRFYLDHRYAGRGLPQALALVLERLRGVHDARIGVVGLLRHYPLYSSDLSNRVEFPSTRHLARFEEIRSCTAWAEALIRRRYDYVVVVPQNRRDAAKIEWTRAQPSARVLLATPAATVFRIDGERGASRTMRCPGRGASEP
jgi:hypothetical protein